MITTVYDFAFGIDNSARTDVVFMEFKKAFDIVPLKELSSIHSSIVAWIDSYIENLK